MDVKISLALRGMYEAIVPPADRQQELPPIHKYNALYITPSGGVLVVILPLLLEWRISSRFDEIMHMFAASGVYIKMSP
jgi:hypothetical protein